ALREAAVAALELLSKLGSLWLHHGRLLSRARRSVLLRTRSLGALFGRCTVAARRALQHFAAEHPDLHADHAVLGLPLGETVVDVGWERVQRDAALAVPLRARDLGAVQAAGHAHLDALGADAHRVRHGAAHRTAELHAALELLRDAFRHELRVELGLSDLGDV